MRRRTASVVAALLALAVAAPGATAAADNGIRLVPLRSEFPERSFLMTLPRGVELNDRDVRVLENGQQVHDVGVTPSALRGSEVGTVLVIDASDSMRGSAIAGAVEAARAFAAQRHDSQPLAIMTFNARALVRLPFTTDGAKIEGALSRPFRLAYETHLYDAIDASLELVKRSRKKAASIVLLSDGGDTGSAASVDAVVRKANAAGVRIFTVGLVSRTYDPDALRTLAGSTGASYSEATSSRDLARIFDALGHRLANEYVLEYRSFAAQGQKVRVYVTVAGVGGAGQAAYRSPGGPEAVPAVYRPSAVGRMIQSPLTMLLIVSLVASLIGLTATTLARPKRSGFRRRLGAFVAVEAANSEEKRPTTALSQRLLDGTERSLGRTAWWARFKEDLDIAEIRIAAEQIIVLTTLGTLLGLWIVAAFARPLFALGALAIPFLVRAFVKYKAERRRRAFGEQLPDNLQVLASALRAGHSLVGALSVVIDDAPEPSRREFKSVIADEQLGVSLEDALTRVAERMHNRDLDQVALVASLQRETGGNTAEVLDRVAETVRERAALRRLVRVLTTQGRMARWIVSGLPIALLLIVSVLNSEYMSPLYSKTAGQILLVVAALMVIAGSLAIRRIINIKI